MNTLSFAALLVGLSSLLGERVFRDQVAKGRAGGTSGEARAVVV